ncbi:dehypoxanthine futalosine cyclase [Verrucomicrobia bacterium LW23]|nr:dehypoxanthine futalosine cyclase [Verrucomicrobia bacterium LW23]
MIQSLLYSDIRAKVFDGERITPAEAMELYHAPLPELGAMANARREQLKGPAYNGRGNDIVTYIIDRNINYTNVCNVYCKFCAFYRTESQPDSYVLSPQAIGEKIKELESIGGTQILMQGGHHPKLKIDYYLELLQYIRQHHPTINIHGFSPPEFNHFAEVFNMPLKEVIRRFKEAGLGSIPGGGGEILINSVRKRISPLKCDADQWLQVMRDAHELGLNSSATMMFGHVETVEDRIQHLLRLRDTQDETGGFTAFICWTFQPDNTKLRAEPVGSHEYLRMQALSRIFLDNFENVQSSWVTQGPRIGQIALKFGANDFGSVMMEENVVSSAGTSFRLTVAEIQRLITEAGYEAHCRNNWYDLLDYDPEAYFGAERDRDAEPPVRAIAPVALADIVEP